MERTIINIDKGMATLAIIIAGNAHAEIINSNISTLDLWKEFRDRFGSVEGPDPESTVVGEN